MNKIKDGLIKAVKWIGEGVTGVGEILTKAPYLVLPIMAVLWMVFRLIDIVFGFSHDTSTYEILMMSMMIHVLLNTEKRNNG